ncbi:DNA glycosylase AlkZ-like family protein [Rhodopirellula sp. MGV]|uniref:DNA glycosylase AlkZ-like family protein n=1 Tax=Rhodopirellula sp. MGV TaxID=2023130 RepID=UPI0013042BF7|nr:crosslink repair DNA glycosylase YcaQ family protein [Rhodopirellula sp. MGV]
MKFVQADPIRSPARAQDLMLRQRVVTYSAGDLEQSFPDLNAEEGFLFAYGFMTPDVWQDLRWRPKGRLKKLEREILDAVAELGEAHPRHLDERFGQESVTNYWGGKSRASKQVLDHLHHHGYLRVCRRENGIRIYQVPDDGNPSSVDSLSRYRNLVLATAHVFGPTTQRFLVSELRYHNHLLATRKERVAVIDSLVDLGSLQHIEVDGVRYLWIRDAWQAEEIPDQVRILAPFDPLVRDRERFNHLWDWDYRFEAYVPAAKRQRGYYAMPVLYRDNVIGWANASVADRRLNVEFGYHRKRPRDKTFRSHSESEVEAMATFLGLESGQWQIEHRKP